MDTAQIYYMHTYIHTAQIYYTYIHTYIHAASRPRALGCEGEEAAYDSAAIYPLPLGGEAGRPQVLRRTGQVTPHTYKYIHIHTHTYIHKHTILQQALINTVRKYIHSYIHTFDFKCMVWYVSIYVCMYVCMTKMYVCMYVCMYV